MVSTDFGYRCVCLWCYLRGINQEADNWDLLNIVNNMAVHSANVTSRTGRIRAHIITSHAPWLEDMSRWSLARRHNISDKKSSWYPPAFFFIGHYAMRWRLLQYPAVRKYVICFGDTICCACVCVWGRQGGRGRSCQHPQRDMGCRAVSNIRQTMIQSFHGHIQSDCGTHSFLPMYASLVLKYLSRLLS